MKLDDLKGIYQNIETGRWIGNIPFPGFAGVRLNVRGLRNADYQRKFSVLTEELPPEKRGPDGLPLSAEREPIIITCLKETVLLGWDGIEDPYTPENVARALADEVLGPAMRDAIFWCANEVAKQSGQQAGQDAKN